MGLVFHTGNLAKHLNLKRAPFEIKLKKSMEVFNELVESIQKESHSMTMIAQLNKELTRLIKHLNDDKKIFQILRKLEEKEVPLGGAQDSVVTAMLPFTALCAGKSSCILSLQKQFFWYYNFPYSV